MTTPKAPPTVRAGRRVRRDRETIELFSEFLAASDLALARVEELLAQPRYGTADSERAHELFRVFHAMKGVAAILKAHDVTRLAHATELLLGGARSERYPLAGHVLALVSEASAALRRLLSEVRRAAELDAEIRPDAQLSALIAKIEAAATDTAHDGRGGPEET